MNKEKILESGKKYKWQILAGLFLLLAIGGWQYLSYRARAAEEEVLRQKDFDDHQVVVELSLKAAQVYYDEYVALKSEDPDYYRVLAESNDITTAMKQWEAIQTSSKQAVLFMQEDIGDLSPICLTNTLCNESQLSEFFSSLERALVVHLQGLEAWANGESYEGNELIGQAVDLLDKAGESLGGFQIDYSAYITSEQSNSLSTVSNEAITQTGENFAEIYSYCDSISPQFHDFARYKNVCAARSESSFLTLNPYNTNYFEIPIKFTGNVSSNTQKIVVTADATDDVYTLTSFKAGDTSFFYQASTEADWNNLVLGYNTYYFVAYFNDGTTATETATIYYYPLYHY